jgi:hypothetical protein
MAAHPAPLDFMCVNWYIQTFLTDQLEEPPFFDSKGQGALVIMLNFLKAGGMK